MARKQKQSIGKATDWIDMVEEVPRAGLPDAEKLRKRARTYRIYLWSAAILLPFALLSNLVMVTTGGASTAAVVKVSNFEETKSVAMLTVENWLKGVPAPLPTGRLLSWDKADSRKGPELAKDEDPNNKQTFETHYMTLTTASGALFTSTVLLAKSNSTGVQVVSQPSLIPRSPSADGGFTGTTPWPGIDASSQKPEEVDGAVLLWAKAFTSGDPATLKAHTQDAQKDRSYVPLSGLSVVGTTVAFSAYLFTADELKNQAETSATMIAQVRVDVAWKSQGEAGTGETAPALTYDVLIDRANTASPNIVAWGAPGTGPSLKKFGNAQMGRILVAPEENTAPITLPTTTPSVTPTVKTPTAPLTYNQRKRAILKKRAAAKAAAAANARG